MKGIWPATLEMDAVVPHSVPFILTWKSRSVLSKPPVSMRPLVGWNLTLCTTAY